MSDIRIGLNQCEEPVKSIGLQLCDFYDQMKKLESDPERSGKQAALIIMTINDIEEIFKKII